MAALPAELARLAAERYAALRESAGDGLPALEALPGDAARVLACSEYVALGCSRGPRTRCRRGPARHHREAPPGPASHHPQTRAAPRSARRPGARVQRAAPPWEDSRRIRHCSCLRKSIRKPACPEEQPRKSLARGEKKAPPRMAGLFRRDRSREGFTSCPCRPCHPCRRHACAALPSSEYPPPWLRW